MDRVPTRERTANREGGRISGPPAYPAEQRAGVLYAGRIAPCTVDHHLPAARLRKKQECPPRTFLPVPRKLKFFPAARDGPMRVARPINKWYNDDENKIARQRQGVTSTLPPAAGDTTARSSRNSAPQGYYTHFAPPRQENLPHCTGLLWPVQCFFVAKYLLCEETKS